MDVTDDPALVPWVLMGTGGLLGAVVVGQLIAVAVGSPSVSVGLAISLTTSVPFIAILVGGGYRLKRSSLPTRRYWSILRWSIGALVAFVIVNVGLMQGFSPDGLLGVVGWLQWAASLGGGTGFLVGYYQVSALEREAVAQRAAGRAEALDRRQELLTYLNGVLRHEVLNTANLVEGYAVLLEESVEPAEQEHARIIRRQATELARVTSDVRVLLHAADGDDDLERLDLTSVLRDEFGKLRDRYECVEAEASLPDEATVLADDLVGRLFSNLLNNAVEHNDRPTPHVTVTATADVETVTVRVEDDGPGVPEAKRDSLFDGEMDGGPDHGLGLAIVAMLADRYEGDVELSRTGPEGSVFTVTLPRVEPAAEATPAVERSSNAAGR